MPHSHATAAGADRDRLRVVFALTAGVFVVQLVGAVASNSLALFADAGHLLTDVVGIGLALLAISFAARPPSAERTFGYVRFEILAAVVNAALLFGVAAFVIYEAWRRLSTPPEIRTGRHARRRGRRAPREWGVARAVAGRPAPELEHARRLP